MAALLYWTYPGGDHLGHGRCLKFILHETYSRTTCIRCKRSHDFAGGTQPDIKKQPAEKLNGSIHKL